MKLKKKELNDLLFTSAYISHHCEWHGIPQLTSAEVCVELTHEFHDDVWSGKQKSHIDELDAYLNTKDQWLKNVAKNY